MDQYCGDSGEVMPGQRTGEPVPGLQGLLGPGHRQHRVRTTLNEKKYFYSEMV